MCVSVFLSLSFLSLDICISLCILILSLSPSFSSMPRSPALSIHHQTALQSLSPLVFCISQSFCAQANHSQTVELIPRTTELLDGTQPFRCQPTTKGFWETHRWAVPRLLELSFASEVAEKHCSDTELKHARACSCWHDKGPEFGKLVNSTALHMRNGLAGNRTRMAILW